jgi:hypothetical protein
MPGGTPVSLDKSNPLTSGSPMKSDPGPRPAGPQRGLLFCRGLLVDVAKHNPSVTERQIADWLVSVYVGKVPRGHK